MSALRGRLGLAALAAFLVADVALVGMALRSTAGPSGAAAASPVSVQSTGSGAPARSGTPAPAGTSTPPATAPASVGSGSAGASASGTATDDGTTPGDAPDPAPLTVGIVAVDAETAWRFTVGSCAEGGSTLATTDDGGSTWEPRATPFDATVRVRVRDDGSAFAIGSDSDCKPRFRQTAKGASTWGAEMPVPGAWFRDPKDPAAVGTAVGSRAKPCATSDVVDLSVTDDAAAALCADGRVLDSDTGATWSSAGSAPGALAVAATDRRTLVVRPLEGCVGLAVVDARAEDTALGCAEVDLAALEPGSVSLSVRADNAWLLAGETVLRSSGDLSEWAAAS